MAKYSYRCSCGWSLKRGDQTRKVYAVNKQNHAETCDLLKEELKRSAVVLGSGKARKTA